MQETLLANLRGQRAQIHERWAALLRVEPVVTPLGHPDALVHLLDWTLDEVFRGLSSLSHRRRRATRVGCADFRPSCPCGHNPLLAYFAAGEQVLHEALVLAQISAAGLTAFERDASLQELNSVFLHIARREIEAFCGVCQHRHPPVDKTDQIHPSPLVIAH